MQPVAAIHGLRAGDVQSRGSPASAAARLSRDEVAREDWCDLYRAVTMRLARSVDRPRGAVKRSHAGEAGEVRKTLLECVEALEHLLAMRMHEHGQ